MPKRLLRRFTPDPQSLRRHKLLRYFGERLHEPNLWHFNRRSVANAIGTGLFLACIPVPGQMVLAAAAAIWLQCNLPLTVSMVWITNPVTMPPIFFFNYKIGAWLLGTAPRPFEFQLSLQWLMSETAALWLPLMIGSLTVGILLGVFACAIVRIVWRFHVIRRHFGRPHRLRSLRRRGKPAHPSNPDQ